MKAGYALVLAAQAADDAVRAFFFAHLWYNLRMRCRAAGCFGIASPAALFDQFLCQQQVLADGFARADAFRLPGPPGGASCHPLSPDIGVDPFQRGQGQVDLVFEQVNFHQQREISRRFPGVPAPGRARLPARSVQRRLRAGHYNFPATGPARRAIRPCAVLLRASGGAARTASAIPAAGYPSRCLAAFG